MTTETDLVSRLSEAQRSGVRTVDQGPFALVDRAAAYRIQQATMAAIGTKPAMLKVAIAPDKTGVVAPIFAGRVGDSGVKLASASVVGLEVEVGVVLKHDVPAGASRATVEAAVSRYFMGVEVCGTRYLDRKAAGFDGGLADNMSAFGYAIDPADWQRKTDVDGLTIVIEFNGETIYEAPAKHGFGGVLESLFAYAAQMEQPYPLTAGTIVTTGSMCGLVPTNGPGKAVARMGGHSVEVELT